MTTLEEALADDEVELVIVTTFPETHAAMAKVRLRLVFESLAVFMRLSLVSVHNGRDGVPDTAPSPPASLFSAGHPFSSASPPPQLSPAS